MRNESPAALLQCSCGGRPRIVTRDVEPQNDPWYGKKMETFVLCECGMCLFDGAFHEGFSSEASACEAWNRRASAAPVASESRGSVSEPINPHFWIDVIRTQAHVTDCREKQQALTNAADKLAQYIAAPTPPAVASGEPTAEQRMAEMVRWLEANQPDVFSRGLWDALARSAAAKGEG